MGLSAVIRNAVATAHAVTADLQVDVLHHVRTATPTNYGKPDYLAGVSRPAVVDHDQRLIRTTTGEEVMAQATVTFIQPVGVKVGDQVTLPGGAKWEVLEVSGVLDPSTSKPYAEEAYLGTRNRG